MISADGGRLCRAFEGMGSRGIICSTYSLQLTDAVCRACARAVYVLRKKTRTLSCHRPRRSPRRHYSPVGLSLRYLLSGCHAFLSFPSACTQFFASAVPQLARRRFHRSLFRGANHEELPCLKREVPISGDTAHQLYHFFRFSLSLTGSSFQQSASANDGSAGAYARAQNQQFNIFTNRSCRCTPPRMRSSSIMQTRWRRAAT